MNKRNLRLFWIILLSSCSFSYLPNGRLINTWLSPVDIHPLYAESLILEDYGNLCIIFKEDGEAFLISEKKEPTRESWCIDEDNGIHSGGLVFNFNQIDQEVWEVSIIHEETSITMTSDIYICDEFEILQVQEEFSRKSIDEIDDTLRCEKD